MTEANTTEISVIDSLALQARALRLNINMNMWQLARVFTEAKEIVPHGQFGKWVEENADVSERTAQDMMAAYKRFGGNPQFEGLGQAKVFRLLPLPAGTEEKFMETHNVASMSTREIQDAVREAREEARREIEVERRARIAAEKRAYEAENAPPAIPEKLLEDMKDYRITITEQQSEIDRLSQIGRDSIQERNRLTQENTALQREIRERDDLLAEQQEDLNRTQQELLNVQSAIAKGDAEAAPKNQLTADALAVAVRSFIGAVARMPQMRTAFARMTLDEKEAWDIALSTVEKWAADSRKALDSTHSEGMVI